MAVLSYEKAALYGNVLDEIKTRLDYIEWALAYELQDETDWIPFSDLSCLQLRKIFEAIAIGCLVVHDDLAVAKDYIKRAYRADKLLTTIGRLHPDFFPRPVIIEEAVPNHRLVHPDNSQDWLTQERLESYYFQLDEMMHVGPLVKRKLRAPVVPRADIQLMLSRTWALLRVHAFHLSDGEHQLLVVLNAFGEDIAMRLHP
jgi:hypothetical protein